jgi:hypothetical protein
MWNPGLDVISLGRETLLRESASLSIFLNQFKQQAKEVQRMAILSSFWRIGNYNQVDELYPLTGFQALKELLVVDDESEGASEENIRRVLGRPWPRTRGLSQEIKSLVYAIIGYGTRTVATETPDSPGGVWKPPGIRIVKGKDEILGGKEVDERNLIRFS